MQLWDESRNVSNAIEMINNKILLTRYFEGNPDMWELKPPLLVWLQALSLKSFGYNEVSARLPSLCFSLLTVLLLIKFLKNETNNIYLGIIASLILVSSAGYVGEHGVRYADHESAIVFFITGFLIFTYKFLKKNEVKFLYISFFFLLAGWFTKSIVIFIFVPPLFIWILANKKFKDSVFNKHFLICSILSLLTIFMYYYLREKESWGYIKAVIENELFSRYSGKAETYKYYGATDFFYYLKSLISERFSPYFVILLILALPMFFLKNLINKKLISYLLLNVVFYLIVISFGTKNFWYDLPVFPAMALALILLANEYYNRINLKFFKPVYFIFFISLIFFNFYNSYKNTFKPDIKDNENWRAFSYFMKENNKILPTKLKIIQNGYFAPLNLYIADAHTKGKNFTLSKTLNAEIGDTFLVYDDSLKIKASKIYVSKIILNKYNCELRYRQQ